MSLRTRLAALAIIAGAGMLAPNVADAQTLGNCGTTGWCCTKTNYCCFFQNDQLIPETCGQQ